MPISVSGGKARTQDSWGRDIGSARTVDEKGRTQTHTTDTSREPRGSKDSFEGRFGPRPAYMGSPFAKKGSNAPKGTGKGPGKDETPKPPVTPPPTTPPTPPPAPPPVIPWHSVISKYFGAPNEQPVKGFKGGGMVRGCGVVERGKTKGKMV